MGIFKKKSRKAKVLDLIQKEYGAIGFFLKDIEFKALEKDKVIFDATKNIAYNHSE